MADSSLWHEADLIVCNCGHRAIQHHGVDPHPVHGGCLGLGSSLPWNPDRCACLMTCTEVLDYHASIPSVRVPYRDEAEMMRALRAPSREETNE